MKKVSSIASYIVQKLWTLFAIVIVLFALLMSLLRYSLPYLDDNKERVENYISEQYAVDLTINELSASWSRSGPSIVLRGVNIAKGEQSPIALYVGELFLEIDFWPSIADFTLQSQQVVLSNLSLDIDLNKVRSGESKFPIIQALERIFLEHLSNFSLMNSRITFSSKNSSSSFDIEDLSWLNKGNRHQGTGLFTVEGFADNHANFILDLYGDVESYSGSIYAQATDIDLSEWFNEFTELDGKLTASKGNVEAWARIKNGEIQRLDGEIKPTILNWQSGDFTLTNQITGKFGAINKQDVWEFSLNELIIKSDENALSADFDGMYQASTGLTLQSRNPINLSTLLPISGLFSLSLADAIALHSLDIPDFRINLAAHQGSVWLRSNMADIAWQAQGNVIGASGIDLDIYLHNQHAKVLLTSSNGEVFSERLFDRNLVLSNANVPIFIDFTKQTSITIDEAQLQLDSLALKANAEYATLSNFLSLQVEIEPLPLATVPLWLPNHLMGENAKTFLSNAFKGAGQVKQAAVLWHGAIHDFPFDIAQNSGVFQSYVAIDNADFLFSDGWPQLSDLDINLLFENKALSMTSPASRLDQVVLTNLRADIPDLTTNSLLTITAQGKAASTDLTALMLQSTLADSLGHLLDTSVVIDGALTTDLQLSIPLDDGAQTRALGKVYLTDNTLTIPVINLKFEEAKGTVVFDNENIKVTGLQAKLFNQHVSGNILGVQTEQQYDLNVDLAGDWDMKQISSHLSSQFSEYINGMTTWNLDVALALAKADFTYKALLKSDLIGVSSSLPSPFDKDPNSSKALVITAQGDTTASSISSSLAKLAKFDGALAHKEKQFNRAHLSIGPSEVETRGVGFSISGDFESLDAQQWYRTIESISSGVASNNTPILALPERIFIVTDKLILLGETFTDVDLRAKRSSDQWILDIDAEQINGNAVIHDEWSSKGIKVDAQYVRLAKPDTQKMGDGVEQLLDTRPKVSIDPKTLPSLDITCKSCVLYGFDLGHLEIKTEPNDDGLKINQVVMDNKFGKISSTGQWYKRNQDHFTFISGEMFSKDFGEFIKQMGFNSGIQDSEANLSYTLTWKDSPFDLRFEDLDGQIDWRLSDGYLTEVSDKGSRIFSLLSLNSLVRKLSLDFRDVFAKGFFYDSMKGSLQITEGKADTRDTIIDGAAGEIEIYGYTDLASQELNYNISFAPNVTGNLPVLVYFMVSPPSALAALALDQVLTSAKVISNVNYSVTGTIKDPILIETGRESTDVELPARRDTQTPDTEPELPIRTQHDLEKIEAEDEHSD